MTYDVIMVEEDNEKPKPKPNSKQTLNFKYSPKSSEERFLRVVFVIYLGLVFGIGI